MRKETASTKARTLNNPILSLTSDRVSLSLKQPYGAPCRPTVEIGRRVRVGDLIAESEPDSGEQLRIHASISGVVTSLTRHTARCGTAEDAIVIQSNGTQDETLNSPLTDETPDAIRAAVRDAGIVGLGGAGFPTHLKMTVAPDDSVDSIIINGCESEPYLTCDYRALIEQPEAVVDGLNLIRTALGAKYGYIVTDADSKEATRNVNHLVRPEDGIHIMCLNHLGALGYERNLTRAALGREIPFGKLPKDVGVVVQNVQTAAAVAQAARLGRPLTSRIITVSGDGVTHPGNYRVPIGTPVQTVLDACGWERQHTAAIVMGGPMMGVALGDLQTSIHKGTNGILALTTREMRQLEGAPCIRCGFCATACPLGLVPVAIARLTEPSAATLESLWADHCVECGECEYACPSSLPLLEKMRAAKTAVARERQHRK